MPDSASAQPSPSEVSASIPNAKSKADQTTAHLGYLDALRGLAFLGVLCLHVATATGEFKGKSLLFTGRYGVQLFFLVSAFTLSRSLSRRTSGEHYPIANFFTRRFFRIAPLFWAAAIFYPWWWDTVGLKAWRFILTFLFLHGWTPSSINSVVPGGWSIGAEWMFYLCLPFLFPRLATVRAALAALLVVSIGGELTSVVCERVLLRSDPSADPTLISTFAWMWFPWQFPIFVLGITLFRITDSTPILETLKQGRRVWWVLGGSAYMFIACTYSNFQVISAGLMFGICFSGVLLALAARPVRLFVNPALQSLGIISFSCYIVHFAFLNSLQLHLKAENFQFLPPSMRNVAHFVTLFLTTLAGTVLVSTLTYKLIEQPAIRLGSRLIKRREAGRTIFGFESKPSRGP